MSKKTTDIQERRDKEQVKLLLDNYALEYFK